MWILIKLFCGLFLAFRKFYHSVPEAHKYSSKEIQLDQGTLYVSYKKYKSSVKGTYFKIALPRKSTFKLKPETLSDTLAKLVGLSSEFQVGKQEFDKKVYLQSDSQDLVKELKASEDIQKLVLSLFQKGCLWIKADTKSLIAYFEGEKNDDEQLNLELMAMAIELNSKPSKNYSLFRDPFFYRAAALESVILGIGGYGIGGIIGMIYGDDSWFVDYSGIVWIGLKWSIFAIVGVLILIVFVLSGSSRSHRIILDNVMMVLIGFPLAGVTLAGDVNVLMDKEPSYFLSVPVVNKRLQVRRSRKGRTTHFYYIQLDPAKAHSNRLPPEIEVNSDLFNDLNKFPTTATLELGKGKLKKRYIKGIKL